MCALVIVTVESFVLRTYKARVLYAIHMCAVVVLHFDDTRWFKYDRD
jgi:hypothetical protein